MNLQQPQQPNLQPIRLPPPVVLPQNPNPIRNLNFRNLPNQNQNPGIFNRQNPNDGQRKPKIFDKVSFTNQSISDPFKLVKVACVYL